MMWFCGDQVLDGWLRKRARQWAQQWGAGLRWGWGALCGLEVGGSVSLLVQPQEGASPHPQTQECCAMSFSQGPSPPVPVAFWGCRRELPVHNYSPCTVKSVQVLIWLGAGRMVAFRGCINAHKLKPELLNDRKIQVWPSEDLVSARGSSRAALGRLFQCLAYCLLLLSNGNNTSFHVCISSFALS